MCVEWVHSTHKSICLHSKVIPVKHYQLFIFALMHNLIDIMIGAGVLHNIRLISPFTSYKTMINPKEFIIVVSQSIVCLYHHDLIGL